MRYYIVAGEASGDLHASRLMLALREKDAAAEFRCIGGDMMQRAGGIVVRHYRDLAYMGFIPVLLHLKKILGTFHRCKNDIVRYRPDLLILVDYPGFNLRLAQYIHTHTQIPVCYFIAPKIWAWKEYRIKSIKKYVDHLFSIFPFEIPFFEGKYHYPIHYVGNPTLDEVLEFRQGYNETLDEFVQRNGLDARPIIAILAGSRMQEIQYNLPAMATLSKEYPDYQFVVAAVPEIPIDVYKGLLKGASVNIIYGQTYALLSHATAAMVTSGTATLEAALFNVPQVVCYKTGMARVLGFLRKFFLKIPYVSLPNLIAGKKVISELVADGFSDEKLREELNKLLYDNGTRQRVTTDYKAIIAKLGETGTFDRTASLMICSLKNT